MCAHRGCGGEEGCEAYLIYLARFTSRFLDTGIIYQPGWIPVGGRGGCTTLRLVLPCFLPVNGVFTTYLQKLIDYGGDVARRLLS